MDNFNVDVTAASLSALELAVELAFQIAPGRQATHWQENNGKLLLAWHEKPGFTPFLGPLDAKSTAAALTIWLSGQSPAGEPDDFDGSSGKGFRVRAASWGIAESSSYVFASIEPIWAEYHK